ncbi:restriction endonuclease subunit S [Faecalibacterium sp. Marseille-P9590]|jgi:type I restriction enzyme, S subunit|uniref:restriction endonuclease subunit S n=1 Tax=Faecalibacterium sp. Marseille-P9590 TaxID=2817017 RepID=UPI001A9C2346|nr:restriction endonuclease subunit S [Faecalibacterium sp. Marseille-P9590]MBO1293601.1 restriction endonuclease subunit S [Faecalibacterium sp. Marseille-P9590]
MAKLGEVCDFYAGTGFPNEYQGRVTGKYPFYKVGDISKNVLEGNRELKICANYVDEEVVQKLKGSILPPKTIVFAKIGEALKLNRRAITSCECLVDNNVMGIKAQNSRLNDEYLFYWLQNLNLSDYSESTTVPSVKKSRLQNIEIKVSPLEEQEKVVSTLNKLSDLILARKKQLSKLDELVKARFVEMFGDFEFNPKEFQVYHLCELCDVGSSKRIYQEEQSISGIPFLKVADLNELIDTGKYSCSTFIPLERYEQLLYKELTPTENDILITSRGTLGKCYIVQSDDEFYFQDGMISWLSNFSPKVSSIYISYLFAQPYIQKQIESLQAGSTVAYLSITMLKKINVILPPKKLQDDFATFVKHVDQQKQTVQQSLEKLELMKKALMQEYFG